MEQGSQATGLYTQEQIDYVSNLKDEDLRDHLLHQIRLRDNLRTDRDAFEKQAGEWPSLPKVIERLAKELSEDKSEGSYYYAWQANIAMALSDEINRFHEKGLMHPSFEDSTIQHKLCNEAAKRFLDLLCSKP